MITRLQEMFKNEKLTEQLKLDWRYAHVDDNEDVKKRGGVVISD